MTLRLISSRGRSGDPIERIPGSIRRRQKARERVASGARLPSLRDARLHSWKIGMAGLYLAPVVCETVSSRERRGRRRRTFPETPKTSIFGLPSANQRTRRFSRTGSLVNAAQFVGATPLMDWRNHPGLLAATESASPLASRLCSFLPSFPRCPRFAPFSAFIS